MLAGAGIGDHGCGLGARGQRAGLVQCGHHAMHLVEIERRLVALRAVGGAHHGLEPGGTAVGHHAPVIGIGARVYLVAVAYRYQLGLIALGQGVPAVDQREQGIGGGLLPGEGGRAAQEHGHREQQRARAARQLCDNVIMSHENIIWKILPQVKRGRLIIGWLPRRGPTRAAPVRSG